MCIASDKITFCTCATTNYNKLTHYWLLLRHSGKSDELILGTPITPTYLLDPNFNLNKDTLEKRLNEPGAFDTLLNFKAKDKLEIVFNNNAKNPFQRRTFNFQYRKGKWRFVDEDPFDLMMHYKELTFGKMKEALKQNCSK
ncbi:MAG: hypothetical protein EOP00_34620 [Pedobacter sp.]|nr:MAG: hypothetical protein EOP00_34620 [Pedobacter sp.]